MCFMFVKRTSFIRAFRGRLRPTDTGSCLVFAHVNLAANRKHIQRRIVLSASTLINLGQVYLARYVYVIAGGSVRLWWLRGVSATRLVTDRMAVITGPYDDRNSPHSSWCGDGTGQVYTCKLSRLARPQITKTDVEILRDLNSALAVSDGCRMPDVFADEMITLIQSYAFHPLHFTPQRVPAQSTNPARVFRKKII